MVLSRVIPGGAAASAGGDVFVGRVIQQVNHAPVALPTSVNHLRRRVAAASPRRRRWLSSVEERAKGEREVELTFAPLSATGREQLRKK
eukprot:gene8613-9060_t